MIKEVATCSSIIHVSSYTLTTQQLDSFLKYVNKSRMIPYLADLQGTHTCTRPYGLGDNKRSLDKQIKRLQNYIKLQTHYINYAQYNNITIIGASRSEPRSDHLYEKIAVATYVYVCMYVCIYVCSDTSSTCSSRRMHVCILQLSKDRQRRSHVKGTVSLYKGRVLLFLKTFEINHKM